MRARAFFRCAVALALLSALNACEDADTGVYWQFERMVVQPRYDSYGSSDFFADGRAMREPPAGTVPRSGADGGHSLRARGYTGAAPDMNTTRLDLPPTRLAAATGVRYAQRIPLAVNAALLATGRVEFDRFCAACHGVLGDGRSPVARKMQLRKPPSLHEARIRAFPPGKLYRIVREGYGLMPGYGGLLDAHQRWAVVAYVRALQLSQHFELASATPTLRAELRAQLVRAAASEPDSTDELP